MGKARKQRKDPVKQLARIEFGACDLPDDLVPQDAREWAALDNPHGFILRSAIPILRSSKTDMIRTVDDIGLATARAHADALARSAKWFEGAAQLCQNALARYVVATSAVVGRSIKSA